MTMDKQFNSFIGVAIIPYVVDLIAKREKFKEEKAINLFYNSEVYKLLSNEDSKVWHYSPLTIYEMWKGEFKNEKIVFPEE